MEDTTSNTIQLKTKVYIFRSKILIGVTFLTELLGTEQANHIFEIEISERISKQVLADFREKLLANKPKKKKGKKGKKKKKK